MRKQSPMRGTILAWLAASGAAIAAPALAADWKSYPFADAGFSVQLPGQPTAETKVVQAPSGGPLQETRYSLAQDGVIYSMEVVDYSAANVDADAAIAGAEKALSAGATVTASTNAMVNRSRGREFSLTRPDGSRAMAAIFFVNRRLYQLVGVATPPDAVQRSASLVRFQESLSFVGQGPAGPPGDPGGPGGFRGRGRGFFGGPGAGPGGGEALQACTGKASGDNVQLDTPGGAVPATCVLVARPDQPPGGFGGGPGRGQRPGGPPPAAE